MNRNFKSHEYDFVFDYNFAKIIFKKYDLIHITNFNLWIICFFYSIFYKKTKFVISLWGLELVYKNKKGVLPFIHKLIVPIKVISKQKNFTFLTSSNSSTNLALNYGINKEKLFKIPLGVSRKRFIKLKMMLNLKNIFYFQEE